MAYAGTKIDYQTIQGLFIEKEFGQYFEYTDNPKVFSQWDKDQGATHRVFVGGLGETRPIKVLKTVAYVMSGDEDQWIKWNIKHCWSR